MNLLWLLIIVPVCFAIGFFTAALLFIAGHGGGDIDVDIDYTDTNN